MKEEAHGTRHSSSWGSPSQSSGSGAEPGLAHPAMLKQHQHMQPGDFIKTELPGNPSSSGVTTGFHSPLLKKKGRNSLCRHLHSQWTHPVTLTSLSGKYAGTKHTKMKEKVFPCWTNQVWQFSCGGCQRDSDILAETQAFSRWESAYIGFMQTFPHLVCNHPFAAKRSVLLPILYIVLSLKYYHSLK